MCLSGQFFFLPSSSFFFLFNSNSSHFIFRKLVDIINVTPLDKGGYYCGSCRLEEKLQPWDPSSAGVERESLFSGGLQVDPETQLFVNIFYDGYCSAPTRYKSTGGLYLSIANQRQEDQRKLENVFLLSLVPPNAPFFLVWERYRKELKLLETEGVKVDGKVHKVRMATFKADSPQRCDLLDHQGVTANKCCPRCPSDKVLSTLSLSLSFLFFSFLFFLFFFFFLCVSLVSNFLLSSLPFSSLSFLLCFLFSAISGISASRGRSTLGLDFPRPCTP